MEQTTTPATTPESEEVAPENRPGLVLNNIAARMMQSRRDIDAYRRGEMSQAEFDALGIKFY
ncbi:hypothetical protein GCM10007423_28420 [Dyadobacter endophyticus]|uniref:Uncharacterized protein n=1 Tax=Dyadobacter endophyticus TaxID=1749036 RepID=A0ABQ1YRN8_9BACT|nr:hypothetical protein [Dyadobacter endophyticus]GGH36238.1 hypothetical protein GCM10007423_28420 [Dyadobacter endophyticus]